MTFCLALDLRKIYELRKNLKYRLGIMCKLCGRNKDAPVVGKR